MVFEKKDNIVYHNYFWDSILSNEISYCDRTGPTWFKCRQKDTTDTLCCVFLCEIYVWDL